MDYEQALVFQVEIDALERKARKMTHRDGHTLFGAALPRPQEPRYTQRKRKSRMGKARDARLSMSLLGPRWQSG
jgi:hypothetical protein